MRAQPIGMGDVIRDAKLTVEIKLTGVRWFKVRLFIGAAFIKLGARIIGCELEFKDTPK